MHKPCDLVSPSELNYIRDIEQIRDYLEARWNTYKTVGTTFQTRRETLHHLNIVDLVDDCAELLKKPQLQLNLPSLADELDMGVDSLADLFARLLLHLDDLSNPP